MKKCLLALLLSVTIPTVTAISAGEVKAAVKDAAAIDGAIKLFDSGARDEAFLLLKTVEKSGDLRVLARLGLCYYSGNGTEADHKLAWKYFQRAEASPDGMGLYGLGLGYSEKYVGKQDLKKAQELLLAALKKGNLYAAGNLGFIALMQGDKKAAVRYFKQGYNASTLPDFWRSGAAFMLGETAENSREKIAYFNAALKLGNEDAALKLAELYHSGREVAPDSLKALEYAGKYAQMTRDKSIYGSIAFDLAIEKMFWRDPQAGKYFAEAADAGEARAYWYAFLYTRNPAYCIAAAEKGDERAYAEAGVILLGGGEFKNSGIAADPNKAIRYYKLASKREDYDGRNAICNLAAIYSARGGKKNMQKAQELFQKTADWYFPRGLRNIGLVYLVKAAGTADKNLQKKYHLKALENLTAAAFVSDENAASMLEKIKNIADEAPQAPQSKFFYGVVRIMQGAKSNQKPEFYAQAVKLIEEAAAQGNMHANMAMAICCQNGLNVPKDPQRAVGFFRKAAAQGILMAKEQLTEPEFWQFVPDEERIRLLKELIKQNSLLARNRYAQILELKGDISGALRELKINAAAGHARSMAHINDIYMTRQNPDNAREAADYLSKAIDLNDGLAQCMFALYSMNVPEVAPRTYAMMLLKGINDGVSNRDFWLHHAAWLYASGKGVSKSPENARKIAEMIINEGYTLGFYTLGEMHQAGIFGNDAKGEAAGYFQKGAAAGDTMCKEALQKLQKLQPSGKK